jgi:hypothetical protein
MKGRNHYCGKGAITSTGMTTASSVSVAPCLLVFVHDNRLDEEATV